MENMYNVVTRSGFSKLSVQWGLLNIRFLPCKEYETKQWAVYAVKIKVLKHLDRVSM